MNIIRLRRVNPLPGGKVATPYLLLLRVSRREQAANAGFTDTRKLLEHFSLEYFSIENLSTKMLIEKAEVFIIAAVALEKFEYLNVAAQIATSIINNSTNRFGDTHHTSRIDSYHHAIDLLMRIHIHAICNQCELQGTILEARKLIPLSEHAIRHDSWSNRAKISINFFCQSLCLLEECLSNKTPI